MAGGFGLRRLGMFRLVVRSRDMRGRAVLRYGHNRGNGGLADRRRFGCRLIIAARVAVLMAMPFATAAAAPVTAAARIACAFRLWQFFGQALHCATLDGHAGQPLDRGHAFLVACTDKHESVPGSAGPAGAADTMDVVVGLK